MTMRMAQIRHLPNNYPFTWNGKNYTMTEDRVLPTDNNPTLKYVARELDGTTTAFEPTVGVQIEAPDFKYQDGPLFRTLGDSEYPWSLPPICHIDGFATSLLAPDGFVRRHSYLGYDSTIVEAARAGRSSEQSAEKTLRYMMREGHTSPFEFVNIIFHVRLPIFVARQWMRHRACVFNEWSARYSKLPDAYWTPPGPWRQQAKTNRQSSEGKVEYTPNKYGVSSSKGENWMWAEDICFAEYDNRLGSGVAREQARSCLPVSTYTEFYWKIDLHNLFHFLNLRADKHAQEEFQEYAKAIVALIDPVFPVAMQAWKDYVLNSITFTAKEVKMLRGEYVVFESESEREAAAEKMKRVGHRVIVQGHGVKSYELVDPPKVEGTPG